MVSVLEVGDGVGVEVRGDVGDVGVGVEGGVDVGDGHDVGVGEMMLTFRRWWWGRRKPKGQTGETKRGGEKRRGRGRGGRDEALVPVKAISRSGHPIFLLNRGLL